MTNDYAIKQLEIIDSKTVEILEKIKALEIELIKHRQNSRVYNHFLNTK